MMKKITQLTDLHGAGSEKTEIDCLVGTLTIQSFSFQYEVVVEDDGEYLPSPERVSNHSDRGDTMGPSATASASRD
jgi:hypothetical protein